MNILTPIVGAIFGVLFTGTIIVIKHLYVIESELRKIQRINACRKTSLSSIAA
jgi:hypothetical protein